MKSLKLIIGTASLIALISCSNDSNENTQNPNLMTLSKTIRYTPSQANYQTKYVAHYNNNEIVSDSTFNNQGALRSRSVWTTNGATKTKTMYDLVNSVTITTTEYFDNSGRLIKIIGTNGAASSTSIFNYNSNSISSGYLDSNSQFVLFKTYQVNSAGLIYKEIDNSNNDEVSTITYNGNIPVAITETGLTFTYFSNPKPSNLLYSDAQINNAILRESRLYRAADNCDQYLKGYEPFYNSTATFNANNYITYKLNTSYDFSVTPAVEVPSFETFYYYN